MNCSWMSLAGVLTITFAVSLSQFAAAQDPSPSNPAASGTLGQDAATVTTTPVPPTWTYQQQEQNRRGTVINARRYYEAPEAGQQRFEHVVTNPRGEMVQTRERIRGEDGYQYRQTQTWTSPDGTLLRQHERSRVAGAIDGTPGTGGVRPEPVPYANTRTHNMTLQDGRTIQQTQTRVWDGGTLTRERNFTGPNGQVQQWQRTRTHADDAQGPLSSVHRSAMSNATAMAGRTPAAPAEKVRWWHKLNPFRKRSQTTTRTANTVRRGFTIGTSNHAARSSSISASERRATSGSQQTHRPSWAGGSPRSLRTQGPPPHANGNATAARSNPGRGRNR